MLNDGALIRDEYDCRPNWAQIYTPASTSISSILELEGKKIAVKVGDIHFEALKKLTNDFNITCRFIEAEDYETVLEMLDADYLDFGVVNRLFGNRNRHRFKVQVAPVVFNPIEMRYAEPKGREREIIGKIDAHLVSYKYHQDSSGLDLNHKLQETHPNLNCLYMSGYTEEVISNHGVLKKGVHFIPKPFTRAELILTIHKVLDSIIPN